MLPVWDKKTTEAEIKWLVNHDDLHRVQFTSIESALGKVLLM